MEHSVVRKELTDKNARESVSECQQVEKCQRHSKMSVRMCQRVARREKDLMLVVELFNDSLTFFHSLTFSSC